MPSINAVHSYLIKPITIPTYLMTVYCLRGTAPIGLYKCKKITNIKRFHITIFGQQTYLLSHRLSPWPKGKRGICCCCRCSHRCHFHRAAAPACCHSHAATIAAATATVSTATAATCRILLIVACPQTFCSDLSLKH
jgi:hypothetical protein